MPLIRQIAKQFIVRQSVISGQVVSSSPVRESLRDFPWKSLLDITDIGGLEGRLQSDLQFSNRIFGHQRGTHGQGRDTND